jgi:hypothetical protein
MKLIDADALKDKLQGVYAHTEVFLNERYELDPLGDAYVYWAGIAKILDAAPAVCCDNGIHSCAFYDPNGLKGFEDGCQYGRIRDSYPPDYCCALFNEAQP